MNLKHSIQPINYLDLEIEGLKKNPIEDPTVVPIEDPTEDQRIKDDYDEVDDEEVHSKELNDVDCEKVKDYHNNKIN